MNAVSTDKLENELSEITDISDFIKKNSDNFVCGKLSVQLNKFLGEKNMSVAEVIQASGLNGGYVYQLFAGTRENPSRDKLLAIAIGMKLEFGDVQKLLKTACMRTLYARDKRDAMIIFSLKKHYSIDDANILLSDNGFRAML